MYKTESAWWWFFLGVLLIGDSIFGLLVIDDGFTWRGVYIPIWTNWLLLPLGIIITGLSTRALLQGKGTREPYTDEDAARAEAEMDAMYLREHGELPEKPKKDA